MRTALLSYGIMKKSHIFLSALLLSLVFSALMTELSMQVSTRTAINEIQQIDMSQEGIEDMYIVALDEEGDDSNSEPTLEDIQASFGEVQVESSVYQYPGYWIFWLKSFLYVFLTTLAVALLQSYWILRSTQSNSFTQ